MLIANACITHFIIVVQLMGHDARINIIVMVDTFVEHLQQHKIASFRKMHDIICNNFVIMTLLVGQTIFIHTFIVYQN